MHSNIVIYLLSVLVLKRKELEVFHSYKNGNNTLKTLQYQSGVYCRLFSCIWALLTTAKEHKKLQKTKSQCNILLINFNVHFISINLFSLVRNIIFHNLWVKVSNAYFKSVRVFNFYNFHLNICPWSELWIRLIHLFNKKSGNKISIKHLLHKLSLLICLVVVSAKTEKIENQCLVSCLAGLIRIKLEIWSLVNARRRTGLHCVRCRS